MKIVVNRYLPFRGFDALTVFNVMLVRRGVTVTPWLVRHETIHWLQQKELLVVGFYVLYGIEFIVRYAIERSLHKAYVRISFEQEAYKDGNDEHYLEHRRRFAWVKYLFKR